jgi:hypothetical protein
MIDRLALCTFSSFSNSLRSPSSIFFKFFFFLKTSLDEHEHEAEETQTQIILDDVQPKSTTFVVWA